MKNLYNSGFTKHEFIADHVVVAMYDEKKPSLDLPATSLYDGREFLY